LTISGLELGAVSRYTDWAILAPAEKRIRGNRQITFLFLYITDATDISPLLYISEVGFYRGSGKDIPTCESGRDWRFFNPLLFASCTGTYSKWCKITRGMKRSAQ
jgi:hypothetical protein